MTGMLIKSIRGIYVALLLGLILGWLCSPSYSAEPKSINFDTIAANDGGVWNTEGLMIAQDVSPPWWQTWIFRSCLAGVVLAIVLTIAMYVNRLNSEIAERKQAENALTESLKRLNSFDTHSTEGVYRVEMKQPISIDLPVSEIIEQINRYAIVAETNASLADMYGLKPEDMIGRPAVDFAPDYGRRVVLILDREGYRVDREKTLDIDKDGNPLYLLESYHGIIYGNMLTAIWGVQTNITELHMAEEALRESERKHRELVENLPQRIFHKNVNSVYISCNKHYAQDLGINPEDITGKTDFDFFPKELADKYRADDQRLMSCGKTEDIEESFIKNGQNYYIQTVKTPLFDDDGNVAGIQGIFWDITDRKKAEQELRKEKHFIDKAINSLPGVCYLFTQNGKLLRWNDNFQSLLGYSYEEIEHLHPWDLCPVEEQPLVKERIGEVFSKGESFVEANLLSKDGIRTLHYLTGVRVDIDGTPCQVGVGIDISDRKRAEEERERLQDQLRQSEKMQTIGQLAGGVAHDFNNILGGIIGAAELLERHEKDNEKSQKFIQMISNAATRAADLTDKLLAFSRKGKSISTQIDIHAIIMETVVLLERSIDRRIALSLKLNANAHATIGDPSQLQSAILNLGVNARDAIPEGGTITISTENVDFDADYCNTSPAALKPGQYIQVSVSDTGMGIDQNIIDRIFEPFFTTKEQGKGTGLGLSAVYGTIHEHGGNVQVSSEPGEGAVFHLYLPVENSESSNDALSLEQIEVASDGGVILLIDDEKVIRLTGSYALEDMGFEVLLAENGEEGVEIYQKNAAKINLVIIDMIMPKMNGTEAFHAIREINPRAKVIMASGYAKDAKVSELMQEGLAGFIKKPFKRNDLAKIIAESIG